MKAASRRRNRPSGRTCRAGYRPERPQIGVARAACAWRRNPGRYVDRTATPRYLRRRGDDPRRRPAARQGARRTARRRDRRQGRVPVGHQAALRRERPARHPVPGGVRRAGRLVRHLRQGRRGSLEGVRVVGADHRGAGARRAADPHRRQRRAETALDPRPRERREDRRVRAHRTGLRFRRRRLDAHQGAPRRRRLRARRHEDLDHQRQRRRRRDRVRGDRSEQRSQRHQRVRRREGHAGLHRRQAREKDGHPRLTDGRAVVRELPRARREPARRGRRRLQDRDEGARQVAPGDRRAGARHRARRARLRDRVHEAARRVRQADLAAARPAVHAGRHEDRGRSGAPAAVRSGAQVRRERAPT